MSNQAASCPNCGKPRIGTGGFGSFLIGGLVLGALAYLFFGGGLSKITNNSMQNITDQVAADAVKQYNIVSVQGDPMQKCVQAGFVSAAYLQAKNDVKYNSWKAIEAGECAVAGVRR